MSNNLNFKHEISNYLAVIYSELQNIEKKHQPLTNDSDWATFREDIENLCHMVHPAACKKASGQAVPLPENSFGKDPKTKSPRCRESAASLEELFPIHNLLQSLTHSWKLRYSKKGFRLIYINQNQESLQMRGIPFEMIQIFNNLLSNSYEALKEKAGYMSGIPHTNWFPEASLILTSQGRRLIIKLIDNGLGIPKEDISHVFEYGMTTKPNGHGIGLAVVKELVCKHQGQICVCSRPPEGCVFRLSFPVEPITPYR